MLSCATPQPAATPLWLLLIFRRRYAFTRQPADAITIFYAYFLAATRGYGCAARHAVFTTITPMPPLRYYVTPFIDVMSRHYFFSRDNTFTLFMRKSEAAQRDAAKMMRAIYALADRAGARIQQRARSVDIERARRAMRGLYALRAAARVCRA